jgi:methionyl-tRNA synthetase
VSEFDASQTEFKDPSSNIPYIKMKEPSYFFRLSKYHNAIEKHIQDNANFIIGPNDILKRLTQNDPLTDISISRTSIDWGIPLPPSAPAQDDKDKDVNADNNEEKQHKDPKHVFYVWFDALANYLTGCPQGMWPPDIQVIGKDITWFHSVIWIGMLMSANIELPKQLFVHSFINDKDGKKMSKSIGNVVSPTDLISKYPASAIRYYLLRENVLSDVNFSEQSLVRCHDSDLLANLGNLVHRTFSMYFLFI